MSSRLVEPSSTSIVVLLSGDGSGVGSCGAASCQSCRQCANNCRYVADPNPNNGLPVRGQDKARRAFGTSQAREGNRPPGRPQGENKPKTHKSSCKERGTNNRISAALWYGPALVRRPARLQARLLALGACAIVISGAVAAAGGADTPFQRAGALRTTNATLAARAHAALLDLYSLDAQLSRAQAQVDALRARAAGLGRERDLVREEIAVAHKVLRVSQQQLALRLSTLYEQQDTDPLAVLLGAESLDAAITGLDDLSRSAEQDKRIGAAPERAQRAAAHLTRTLAGR